MEKTNINRLLRVFIPFIIMVMTQNTLLLIFGRAGMSGNLPSLTAFIVASAAAVFLFHIQSYEPSDSGKDNRKKHGRVGCVMYFFFTVAMLIISMYGVSFVISNYNTAPLTLSPLYVVSLLVIHPILEEYIFRGLFYGELRKMNPIFGVTAQAIMFAIIHGTIDGMIYALFSGIFLGIAAEKSGRLWVPCAAHIFINARSLLYLTWLADNDVLRQRIDMTFVSVGLIAVLILLWMRGRSAVDITAIEASDAEAPAEEILTEDGGTQDE